MDTFLYFELANNCDVCGAEYRLWINLALAMLWCNAALVTTATVSGTICFSCLQERTAALP
jgi:hypothetical protein